MSKKIQMPRFTDKSDIRLGFEVECYVRSPKWDDFSRKMRGLRVQIGDDGSIEPPDGSSLYTYNELYTTAELRTRPLPPSQAMKLLKEILRSLHGTGGTNDTCGLHVNISSVNKTKMKQFNRNHFFRSRLWQQMLKRFDREENDYCYPIFDDNPPTKRELERGDNDLLYRALSKARDKYACVNTCHFGDGSGGASRIEIRAMGNYRYHCRYKLIAHFVSKIIKQFQEACKTTAYPKMDLQATSELTALGQQILAEAEVDRQQNEFLPI